MADSVLFAMANLKFLDNAVRMTLKKEDWSLTDTLRTAYVFPQYESSSLSIVLTSGGAAWLISVNLLDYRNSKDPNIATLTSIGENIAHAILKSLKNPSLDCLRDGSMKVRVYLGFQPPA